MSSDRTIIVGDVHGCMEELSELLRLSDFRRGKDKLAFTGDLVDRGPASREVVRFVRDLGAMVCKGNHEEKHLRYRRHEERRRLDAGYANPMKSISEGFLAVHRSLGEDDFEYLERLPLFHRLDANLAVIHGGLEPGKPLEVQKANVLVRCRYVGAPGSLQAGRYLPAAGPRQIPPGSCFWTSAWTGPENVIYGHHVHDLAQVREDRPRDGVCCWGLDTGCCFGGHLTAMIRESEWIEYVQVKARATYAEFLGNGDE